jgi:tetratricopeptide (TPR) repeat protein
VPLGTTFTGRDVTIANAHSKAVLRAACDAATLEREGVDYFPSYEMVTLTDPRLVWKQDRLHVSQGFIGKIVGHMLDHYFEGVDPALVRHQRARALLADGEAAAAEEVAREALALKPDHVDTQLVLGMALIAQSHFAEAQKVLKGTAKDAPERSDVRVHWARALAGRNKVDRAVALLKQALAQPGFTAADFLASDSILYRAAPEEAVGLAARAAELFPRREEVHARLVEQLLRADRKPDAVAALRRIAPESHPSSPLMLQFARLLLEMGEREEAAARIDLALAHDHGNEVALALKAVLGAPLT